jgi:hypothetical protein
MTELKRERTFTWGNPLIGASAGLKMSGIDYRN